MASLVRMQRSVHARRPARSLPPRLELAPIPRCNGIMASYELLRTPITGIVVDDSACESDDLAFCGGVQVTVPATDSWAGFVARAVDSEWVGIEALAGIPGTVADAVRGNAAAHGQSIADTLASVRTWDRSTDAQRTIPVADLELRDGGSPLSEPMPDGTARYELLEATFLFRQGDLTGPIRDAHLAALLGIDEGERVPLTTVRDAMVA